MDYKLWIVAYAHSRKYGGTYAGVLLVAAETQDGAALTARDDFARRTPDRRTDDYVNFGDPELIEATTIVLGADGKMHYVSTLIVGS